MEPGNIAQWGAFCVSLASFGFILLTYRSRAAADRVEKLEKAVADKASAGRMGALEDRVDKVEDRTTSIEGELRHLPSRDQTHAMEIAVQEMKGQLAVLNERMQPVAATSARLQEWLLEDAQDIKRRGVA